MWVWLPSSCCFREEKEPPAHAERVCRPKNWSRCGVSFCIHAGNRTPVSSLWPVMLLTGLNRLITCNIHRLKVYVWRVYLLAGSNVGMLKEKASVYAWDAALILVWKGLNSTPLQNFLQIVGLFRNCTTSVYVCCKTETASRAAGPECNKLQIKLNPDCSSCCKCSPLLSGECSVPAPVLSLKRKRCA